MPVLVPIEVSEPGCEMHSNRTSSSGALGDGGGNALDCGGDAALPDRGVDDTLDGASFNAMVCRKGD